MNRTQPMTAADMGTGAGEMLREQLRAVDTGHTNEDSMKSFIHEHLSGILQPFADRIDFLTSDLAKLKESTAAATSLATGCGTAIEQVRGDLHKVHLKADSIIACQEAKHKELSQGKVAMKKELQKQADEISAMSSRQNQMRNDLNELQRCLKDSKSHANQIMSSLAEVENKVNPFDFSSVERLQMDLDRLERAHESTALMARDTAYQREKDHVELLQLADEVKYHHHKQEGKNNAVNASHDHLQKRIDKTNHILDGVNHTRIAQAYDDVAALQRHTKQMQKEVTALTTRTLERAGEADNLRAAITDLKTAVGGTEDSFKTGLGLQHHVRQLQNEMQRNAVAMNEIVRKCDRHSQELQDGSRRINEIERIEPHLHVAHRELESQMSGRLKDLETNLQKAVQKQEMQKFKERDLQMSRRDTDRTDVPNHDVEREKEKQQLKQQLYQMGAAHESAEQRARIMEDKLNALIDTVASLRGGVDLTHEYWKGLTKGVQKTHRSVLAEDEIFAKNPLSKPLPSLSAR